MNKSAHLLPPKPPCSPAQPGQLAIFMSRIACELKAYYQGIPPAHRSNAKDFFFFLIVGMGSGYCPTYKTLHFVRDLSNLHASFNLYFKNRLHFSIYNCFP